MLKKKKKKKKKKIQIKQKTKNLTLKYKRQKQIKNSNIFSHFFSYIYIIFNNILNFFRIFSKSHSNISSI